MLNIFKWTPQQLAIFNWFIMGKGNILIRARAGCTKTTVCVEGLNRSNTPDSAYFVFAKKNQLEAEKKITNKKVTVKTFHGYGYGIVLKHWRGVKASSYAEFGRVKSLEPAAPKQIIFQTAKLVTYLKNLFLNPTLQDAIKTAIERNIELGKNEGWTIEKISEIALKVINISKEYPKDKLISFEDMLWLPNVMGWINPAFYLVVVDETQDMNYLQLLLAEKSCFPNGRICLVGDDRQQIFGFRGAMHNGLDTFKEKLNAKEFPLTVNFRCGKKIISLAQIIVPDIQAAPDAIEGEILAMGEEKMLNEIKVKDTILSRTNAPLMKACLSLIRKKIPAYVEGREVGKVLIDIIDEINCNSINDFFDKLQNWLDTKIARSTGWNSGNQIALYQDQHETLRVLAESALSIEDIKTKINSLFLDADYVRVPSVVCQTVHKSKGLEYDNVYMLMDTFNGGKRKLNENEAREEENIVYCAVTRAKNKLIQVSSKLG